MKKSLLLSLALVLSLGLSGCSLSSIFGHKSNNEEIIQPSDGGEEKEPSSQEPSEPEEPSEPSEPEEPEVAQFPSKEVISFFDGLGIEVVIPNYVSSNNEIAYELDDSVEGYLDVYITGSNHEEMVTYKDALVEDSWVVVGEENGDFRLQFDETIAFVDLIDFEDYLLASFFTHEEPEIEYTAEKICEDFNANLASAGYGSIQATWDDTYQEFSTAVNFGASSDESENNLGSGCYTLASFLPEYMALSFEVYGDPTSEDYYDLFGDASYYYYMGFDSPDGLSSVVVISYIYSDLLIAQISIYNN